MRAHRMKTHRIRSGPQLLYLVTLMSNLLRTDQRLQVDSRPYEGELCEFSRFESLGYIYFVQVKDFGHVFYRKQ